MSNGIPFCMAVYHPRPATFGEQLSNFFDDFFYTGGERAEVTEKGELPDGKPAEWVRIEKDGESSSKILKLILKCTVVVPIFMLIGKFFCRLCRNYLKGPGPGEIACNQMQHELDPEREKKGLINTSYQATQEQIERMQKATKTVVAALDDIFSSYIPATLLASSKRSYCLLPVYPISKLDKNSFPIQEEEMAFPVMQGIFEDGRPYFALKLVCNLTDEIIDGKKLRKEAADRYKADRQLKEVLLLQNCTPCKGGENIWRQSDAVGAFSAEFFTSNFTFPHDGSLNTQSQKDNIKAFKTLLSTGTSQDTRGIVWSLDFTNTAVSKS